jgi:mRNA interferase RelE/StbE
VSYEVVWSDEAFAAAQTYLADDPKGLAEVFDAVDSLVQTPRPDDAFARGGDLFRMRVGRYRVIYEVTKARITITVIHPGRS